MPARLPARAWPRTGRDGYDWRAQEAELNAYPQFTTEIDGQNIHFLHVRSPEPDAAAAAAHPRLAGLDRRVPRRHRAADRSGAHGGDPADAFHVVIPSLPGFGFSGPLAEAGLEHRPHRRRVRRADGPARLRAYGVQGGDGGAWIAARDRAGTAPDRVVGVHVNGLVTFPSGRPAPSSTG